jgi:hypothetical protein
MGYHNNEETTIKAIRDANRFINDRARLEHALRQTLVALGVNDSSTLTGIIHEVKLANFERLNRVAQELKVKSEPDAFIVLDSDGDHLYSSTHKQFCHDHINELLMDGSEAAGEFVVRGFYAEPRAMIHLSDDELMQMWVLSESPADYAHRIELAYGLRVEQ